MWAGEEHRKVCSVKRAHARAKHTFVRDKSAYA